MPEVAYAIHALPVLDGTLALSAMPGRTRQYHADWQVLKAWNPKLVISMTEQSEMDCKGAGSLGLDLADAGVDWLHLPVRDYGVPEHMDWDGVRKQVFQVLSENERVLVHCFGGCGRSGMMALRLMIASGEDCEAALARLRAVRPCAVETDAQMAWACLG